MKHDTPNHTRATPLGDVEIFDTDARASFSANYPEIPHKLRHRLPEHPLLALSALAELGEWLPASSVEYNRGNVPIGVDSKPGATGLTIGETIRSIKSSNSWAVLKNIEQNPAYADLLAALLGELKPVIEAKTGKMLKMQGFIFVSSPDAVTPYHFDPEHNILLQLVGNKVMTQFPAGNSTFAPDQTHETYHTGGARELGWKDELTEKGTPFPLGPGEGLFVPVMAPHFVKNGTEPSISLSITWRSDWSYEEADARAFNKVLRGMGFKPKAPGRWPRRNTAKAIGWRLYRKFVKR